MKIEKVESDFAQVPNSPLFDPRLSWKAKGIFAYIQAKPNDYDFSSRRMATGKGKETKDGLDSTIAGIKELEMFGYLVREKQPDGRVHYKLQIPDKKPDTENPYEGKSQLGKIRTITNTDIKQILINNKCGEASSPFVWEEYLKGLLEHKDKRMNIIGFFFKAKEIKFNTIEKAHVAIKRHLRAATELLPFDKAEIGAVIRKLNYDFPKFTLETVLKELTK